ncbi:MAG TPA: hypothetical protein DEA82_10335 [Flavobacteriaceae bacterium]|nr:hypothetical protein [Flavobacteriaceae bacterium]HBR54542.1 hypothetical protein [Flavobacteriaceae bacterium]|tara:strand:- start:1191 stop:1721 length:531 start_codon:yes stop_codon:yes gene_type:complete
MTTQNSKSKRLNRSTTDKKSLFIGGILVVIIASTPFLFYSYESFPDDSKVWETFFFTATTGYDSFLYYAWYFVGKAIPLLLLLIWFFTCRHWWHWIILVPIAMYAFQLWGVINQNYNQMDELEIFYVIPLMMVLVPFVYLIRARLFAKVRGDSLQKFEEELGTKRTFWKQISDLFR